MAVDILRYVNQEKGADVHYAINDIIGPRYGGEQCTAELYEDNGGGLHLFLLDEGRSVLYGEYDRDVHHMAQSWVAIMQGSKRIAMRWIRNAAHVRGERRGECTSCGFAPQRTDTRGDGNEGQYGAVMRS